MSTPTKSASPRAKAAAKPDAKLAIDVLRQLLDKTSPATMAFWTTPNVILTLAGARGVADGIFYSEDKATRTKWKKEITESLNALKQIIDITDDVVSENTNPMGDAYVAYDIVARDGLVYSLEQTEFIPAKSIRDIVDAAGDMRQIVPHIVKAIEDNPQISSHQDIITGVASGLVYGYPDPSIAVGERLFMQPARPFEEKLINADIRGGDFYDCPQPIYSYPRSLMDNPVIRAHEKLWSTVLEDFYTSELHLRLAADKDFTAKQEETGTYCHYPDYLQELLDQDKR